MARGPVDLAALRSAFVQGATWDSTGNMTGVTFFPPNVILEARRTEGMDAAMSSDKGAPGDVDETEEMTACRMAAENAKSGEEAEHHAARYRKLLHERMSYYSG